MTAQTTNCADLTQRTTKADYPPRAKRTQWNGYLARNRLVLQLTLHMCAFPIILAFCFHQIWSFFWCFHQKNEWETYIRIGFLPKITRISISVLNFYQKRMRPSFPRWVFTKNVWDTRFRFVFSRNTYVKFVFALGFYQKTYVSCISVLDFFQKRMRQAFPLWFLTNSVCDIGFRVDFLP